MFSLGMISLWKVQEWLAEGIDPVLMQVSLTLFPSLTVVAPDILTDCGSTARQCHDFYFN